MNAISQQVSGIFYNVPIEVGSWRGKHHIRVVQLDHYNVVLGLEFLVKAKIAVVPHMNVLQIMDERSPGFLPCISTAPDSKVADLRKRKRAEDLVVSAGSIATGLRHGEVTYLALTACTEIEGKKLEIHNELQGLLGGFEDLMPAILPKCLPPRCDVDH